MNANQLIHECNAKTAQELAPFAGQWVAWSEDGQRILAHAPDLSGLFQEIDRLGMKGYVIDSIPLPDEDFLGGATL